MPDWTYHTFLGPAIFATKPQRRRRILNLIDEFGSSGAAAPLVELVGHMRPDAALRTTTAGMEFAAPFGFSADLSGNMKLLSLVSRFGVGFVEIGPVGSARRPPASQSILRRQDGIVEFPARPETLDVAEVQRLLARPRASSSQVIVRLEWPEGASPEDAVRLVADVMKGLAQRACAFTLPLDADSTSHGLEAIVAQAKRLGRPFLGVLRADDASKVALARAAGLAGIWIRGGQSQHGDRRVFGGLDRDACLAAVRRIRESWPAAIIVAGAGLVDPGDGVAALDAGADLAAFEAGLVLTGPGLPKRANEALLAKRQHPSPGRHTALARAGSRWAAFALLGAMLIMSGAVASVVAFDRVVLPYDEEFLRASRDEIASVNDRLIPFLSHDRIALASTTVSIGVLYVALAVHGARTGARWPGTIVVASAIPGFASLLLYSLYGYFDPLDARATLLMLLVFVLALVLPNVAPAGTRTPDLRNDPAWRLSLVGQAGFVGLGIGFITAGLTIAIIGSTRVFVASDLEFLQASAASLQAANDRLLPLVAHDRSRFGGALVSVGVAIVLTALWAVRRGAAWVWWAFALAGVPGFVGGIGVHVHIGYRDAFHLALPVVAMIVYIAGLILLYPYLCGAAPGSAKMPAHAGPSPVVQQ